MHGVWVFKTRIWVRKKGQKGLARAWSMTKLKTNLLEPLRYAGKVGEKCLQRSEHSSSYKKLVERRQSATTDTPTSGEQ